ncbi:MAG: mechanosensitive ion channel family protein [Candidatus Saccharibacteria bacterium]|nr:mechanosensitive ion channel family protein [Candidatus Saccharibacteria bacterium]
MDFSIFTFRQYINPLIYIAIALVIYFILSRFVALIFDRHKEKLIAKQLQRIITVKAMIMSIIKYIMVIGVLLASLANFGVDISSLLAGIGIAGAVLGLAFQDLAKDIIAGISIITEGQYEVGDLIEVDGFKGRVVSVGLKTTRIKNFRGKVKIISNRNMDELINYSKFDTLALVDVLASYEDDPEKVEKALENVKKNLDGTMEQMTGEIKFFPVTGLEESGIKYRVQCPCKSYKHFAVQRAIRKEVYKEFKKNRIEIPYPQIEIHSNK